MPTACWTKPTANAVRSAWWKLAWTSKTIWGRGGFSFHRELLSLPIPCRTLMRPPFVKMSLANPGWQPSKEQRSRRRRDALGPLSTHPTCATLLSHPGRPAEAPAQLALITVMPWAAGLSDAQAAAAVRARMDGQDAVALAWTAPGCAAAGL